MHAAMKSIAIDRRLYMEDVYREAVEYFLAQRACRELDYLGAPKARFATRVNVKMADDLRRQVRAAADEDHQELVNAFETAVRLYLELHGHSRPTTR